MRHKSRRQCAEGNKVIYKREKRDTVSVSLFTYKALSGSIPV